MLAGVDSDVLALVTFAAYGRNFSMVHVDKGSTALVVSELEIKPTVVVWRAINIGYRFSKCCARWLSGPWLELARRYKAVMSDFDLIAAYVENTPESAVPARGGTLGVEFVHGAVDYTLSLMTASNSQPVIDCLVLWAAVAGQANPGPPLGNLGAWPTHDMLQAILIPVSSVDHWEAKGALMQGTPCLRGAPQYYGGVLRCSPCSEPIELADQVLQAEGKGLVAVGNLWEGTAGVSVVQNYCLPPDSAAQIAH
ncbi:uncharacterized protein VTP21DRAFT_9706 [Calcarisporiella thermophila]|uniref:uncharacterized protein n=1 Tax=Calcarisporiella thermophila TaxID=911321 RepID=UPI003743869B